MTREELYALVWETPREHIAKRFGISSARLRTICHNYNVPMPSPGYWTKRAHGMQVERPSLPPLPPTILGKINAALRRIGEVPLQIADAQIAEYSLSDISEQPRTEASFTDSLDPCARLARQALHQVEPDQDGFLNIADPRLPTIRIGPQSTERAVQLIHAFVKALRLQNTPVVASSEGLRIDVQGELFAFRIYETRRKAPSQPRQDVDASISLRPTWPSGRLCLEIIDPRPFRWSSRNLVGQWFDREGQPVEETIDRARVALVTAAATVKHCRALAEQQDSILDQQAQLLREEEALSERAEKRRAYLLKKSEAYARMVQLIQFADFLETQKTQADALSANQLIGEIRKVIADMRKELELASLIDRQRADFQ